MALLLKNIISETEKGEFFYPVRLLVTTPNTSGIFNNNTLIQLETPLRASIRYFTEKYYFIAALPFLLPLLGELWKRFAARRHDRKLAEAQKEMENYQKALASLNLEEIQKEYAKLSKHLNTCFSDEDQKRFENINDLCKGDWKGIEPEMNFKESSDMWSDALMVGLQTLKTQQKGNSELDIAIGKLKEYLRLFPTDALSNEAYLRFMKCYKEEVSFPDSTFTWPPNPDVLASSEERIEFFSDKADDFGEQSLLFNTPQRLFWPDHPLYKKILATKRSFFIQGDIGCGKTAFALALTRLPNPEAPISNPFNNTLLTSYHRHVPVLEDIQEKLGRQLLSFISQNATSMAYLVRRERDLMSRVLLSVFDDQYIFSVLEKTRSEPSNDTDKNKETDKGWKVVGEISLIWKSVKEMANRDPLSLKQWFDSLIHCLKSLNFSGIRIVLDLDANDWKSWKEQYLLSVRSVFALEDASSSPFVQLVIFTENEVSIQKIYGFQLDTLTWSQENGKDGTSKNLLFEMAKYRLSQEDFSITDGIIQILLDNADSTPRGLMQLWNRVKKTYPDDSITNEMVIEAAKAKGE